MASLLESRLKRQVAKAFKNKLTKGIFRRMTPVTAVDANGDPVPPTPVNFQCEGIRENFKVIYREMAKIPETDVSILLIQGLFVPATTITKADQDTYVYLKAPWNKWHKVRSILEIDPAGATVRLQCYEVPDL